MATISPTAPVGADATSPPLLAKLAFLLFVLGGFAFGGIFLGNTRHLMTRSDVTVSVPVVGERTVAELTSPFTAVSTVPQIIADARSNPAAAAVNVLLPEWNGKERINIVLLGIDRRPGETYQGTRSDTIMLASIDPVAKSAALVSLPRDLWVSIPGYGQERINVAHAVGGPDLTKRTILADFGINVKYFVRVDFKGFEDLVNTAGGVIIDVERPVKDDAYPTVDYGYQRIYVDPGPQFMVGETALQYARSRHSENDFGRAARQQKVILGLRDRVLQLNMLPKAPEMLGIVREAVSTDLSPQEMLALARLGSEIDRDRIANIVIDAEYARPCPASQCGGDVLLPDTQAIRRAIDRVLASAARPETRAKVEVLNGTTRTGLGERVADVLRTQGFDVVRIAAADRNDYTTSVVETLTGNELAGTAVRNALKLPDPALVEGTTPSRVGADLRVVIGQDLQLPSAPPTR